MIQGKKRGALGINNPQPTDNIMNSNQPQVALRNSENHLALCL